MLLSLAIIILLGFALYGLFGKIGLPGLLGLLLAGILLGPHALNLLDDSILAISADLRKLALIVILVRAGLALDLRDLRLVGRPAVLLGFVPALLEMVGATLLGVWLLGLSLLEAALLGAVLAAVSPAIVIPAMLRLMARRAGGQHHVPQMIMAGATVDNIFVLIVFSILLNANLSGDFQPQALINMPLSILTGLLTGILAGLALSAIFKALHVRDTVKVLLILGLALLAVGLEDIIGAFVPFSGILAVVALAATVSRQNEPLARRLSGKFSKLWVMAELMLFVLVGALVDVTQILPGGLPALAIIIGALLFRGAGVWLSTAGNQLQPRERVFTVIAYLPKASLQAVLGTLPLAAGLACGPTILSVAVIAIILTAPLGAIGIEKAGARLPGYSPES